MTFLFMRKSAGKNWPNSARNTSAEGFRRDNPPKTAGCYLANGCDGTTRRALSKVRPKFQTHVARLSRRFWTGVFVQAWPNLSLSFSRPIRDEQRSLIKVSRRNAIPWLEYPESPVAVLHQWRHPEPSLPCFIRNMLLHAKAKDLLYYSSGPSILRAVLDNPIVQRSRSFGFARTVSKHIAFRVACLSGWRVAVVRWMTDVFSFFYVK